MKRLTAVFPTILCFILAASGLAAAEADRPTTFLAVGSTPLSLRDAVNHALERNGTIRKAQSDLEATYGVVVQTRAIAIPKVKMVGDYLATDATEKFPVLGIKTQNEHNWSANIRVVQSLYEGGRVRSALRSAKLTKEQGLLRYQSIVADVVLEVQIVYYDILLAAQQITVQEASLGLLQRELEDATRRFEAGTVPRFNVLRAEVEVANARPRVIRARNSYRISKNNLSVLLGYDVPHDVWEDIPLQLSGRLEAEPYEIALPVALGQALERRPELGVLRKAEGLRQENVIHAKAGYKPSLQLFTGYGSRNSTLEEDLTRNVPGWQAGAHLNWELFDGLLTKGKIQEARALQGRAHEELADTTRRIELEVRTAYSNFIEAREVLESQKKVQEQAEESLRLATSRNQAGTGTQLDVLNAQTALTEARTTQIQALRDYSVARAKLERATGANAGPIPPPAPNP